MSLNSIRYFFCSPLMKILNLPRSVVTHGHNTCSHMGKIFLLIRAQDDRRFGSIYQGRQVFSVQVLLATSKICHINQHRLSHKKKERKDKIIYKPLVGMRLHIAFEEMIPCAGRESKQLKRCWAQKRGKNRKRNLTGQKQI